ncbi:hypothetical protein [Hoeflea prorocentri]|uniref:Uncharacterized protein n=1 Tax=Hoeflea prorocentri TaxID=1922333 RepID=A0A9X3ULG9_9HYPH|nr:hypothetical protein [Hoeflea prorocentri]MCY6383433.1 hypothetical protein [Hoeflea prorocentri]MDA5401233.1 hypothetical protein [Hoeflea prorocentri]
MELTSDKAAPAALTALIILQLVMLGALFAGVPPHPPETTPLFGIGPFLGMSLSVTAAALMTGSAATRTGSVLCVLAVLCAFVSFGPQKYFDEQFDLIWPAVVCGQFASVVLLLRVFAGPSHRGVSH